MCTKLSDMAAARPPVMSSVRLQLSELCYRIRKLHPPRSHDEERSAVFPCICEAICNLGYAASPGAPRLWTPRTCTSELEEVCYLREDGYLGDVVEVRHRVTGETFAIKTLNYPYEHDEEEEEEEDESVLTLRILREASFLAACRGAHPSIIGFHGVGYHPGTDQHGLVMENAAGATTLHAVLKKRRHGGKPPLPEREVRRIVRQVLAGAKAMHGRGVVHRAIDPSSVLLGDGGGTVKIVNFGSAASVSESESESESWADYQFDTVNYIAPELLLSMADGNVSDLVDSWSIGCVMAELLTGKVLFDFNSVFRDSDRVRQLLVDVIGAAEKKDMKVPDSELARGEVKQWRSRHGRLGELIPLHVLSDDGFDVLDGLLTRDPKKRLTTAEALQLPWFTDNDDSLAQPLPLIWVLIGVLALLVILVFVYVRF